MLRLNPAPIILFLVFGCAGGSGQSEAPAAEPEQEEAPPAAEPQQADAPAPAPAATEGGDKPVGTKLMNDASESKKKFAIGMGGGDASSLGNFSLRVDDKPVWPPKGPGCDALIDCCNRLIGEKDTLALPCLMATGRDKDCTTARGTVHAIAKEQGVAPPKVCGP